MSFWIWFAGLLIKAVNYSGAGPAFWVIVGMVSAVALLPVNVFASITAILLTLLYGFYATEAGT